MAQPLRRPIIWSSQDERADLLEMIEQKAWAASYLNQLKNRVNGQVTTHLTNPAAILSQIPPFAVSDHQYTDADATTPASNHKKVLSAASDAAMLFFITEEEKYAQFAADVLNAYFEHLAPLTPETTTICGNYFYDPRTTYNHIALAYDFAYDFLNAPTTTVYKLQQGARVPFDNAKAQKAIANIVGNALQEYGRADTHGRTVSNHPILTAPGALFGILCIDDAVERERLLDVFWTKGTWNQSSFTKTILPMFTEQGLWPESLSYSFMPNVSLVLNVIDRVKPEWEATAAHSNIFNGIFLFDYLRLPDRRFVRYGDSKRNNDSTEALYRYALTAASRRGCVDLERQAQAALKQAFDESGGRPSLGSGTFDNYEPLKLFWGLEIPPATEALFEFDKPTALVTHAGIALQRNVMTDNKVDHGLVGIIGGAHYVHSHAVGISMELYGAGYVMAPNAGLAESLAERKLPENAEYFRLHAGNNGVIVNGTSHGRQSGSWSSNSYVWQNTAVNRAAEPAHLQDPVSHRCSFATQYLNDTVNDAQQERTLAIIRTGPTTGFYFDLFRSRSLGENNFHDYIYHNIGDETLVSDDQGPLVLVPTNRYDNDIGDYVKSPGWRYFEQEKVTAPTAKAVQVQFRINSNNRSMNLFIPDGVEREFTHALAPATREAKNGYVNKKTHVLAIRQQGEAWDRPYVVILEPSTNFEASVQSVSQLTQSGKVLGAKVVSRVAGAPVYNYIICQDSPDAVFEDADLGLRFSGRYAVVTDRGNGDVELYIGEGSSLSYGNYALASKSGSATAAASLFLGDRVVSVKARDGVDVAAGESSLLSIERVDGNFIVRWHGLGMTLQRQLDGSGTPGWEDVPDTSDRSLMLDWESSKSQLFRLKAR